MSRVSDPLGLSEQYRVTRPDLSKTVADEGAAYQTAKALWQALSAGPWVCDDSRQFDDPLLLEIVDIATPGALVRDTAAASAQRQALVAGGFLTARRLDHRHVEFAKAKECPEPDTRPWDERMNEHLRSLQAEEQRLKEEDWAARERAAKAVTEPYEQARRVKVAKALDELGVSERLDRLEQAIGRIEAALAASNTDALVGAQEGSK